MQRTRLAAAASIVALALCSATAVRAQDDPYDGAYTPEELAALDTALEAGNLLRADLTFRKDVTQGVGCIPEVREMLRDPLRIAPFMDRLAARTAGDWGRFGHPGARPPSRVAGAVVVGAALLAKSPGSGATSPEDALLDGVDAAAPPTAARANPEALLAWLAELAARQPALTKEQFGVADDARLAAALDVLRAKLPAALNVHDVLPSPFDGERQAAVEAWAQAAPQDGLHVLADHVDPPASAVAWFAAFGDPLEWLPTLPAEAFPHDAPLVRDTPYGRVALGTPGDDVWTGEYAVLIDPGGNDRYLACRVGAAFGTEARRVGFFADLGGDDVHDGGDVDVTCGAAILGVAAFLDLGAGDDRYVVGHCSLGAAMGGTAVFYDDGGSDTYEGRSYTEGAAGFGVAVFLDDAVQPAPVMTSDQGTREPVDIGLFDNDSVRAWVAAQGFARPRAVALCINTRGNDVYEAGGVYLDAPLFADRYESFAQGFSIGERGIDWAGGIAALIDRDGNDRYLGDIYDQGVGYWYGAGLLWDGGGNDTYEMTQYGQGSGIHLAVGGLVDVAGHDTYVMHSGLGQGGSHDYASGLLHDRGGNDRYLGSTSCNGCGLTNSVGIQIDRSGDDLYGARRNGGFNSGRPAREFASIGVLVDLGGKDDYHEEMRDGDTWRRPDIGVGIDVLDAADAGRDGAAPAPDTLTGKAEIPAVCSYEGDLEQSVFDELWAIACRWEVGDNRVIVPEARKRLVAFGAPVLPFLDAKMETDDSGLELRAYVSVLTGIADGGARDDVLAFLRTNAQSDVARRRRVALYLVGELKTTELEDVVLARLASGDDAESRRAAGVLAALGSHAGDATLRAWLASDDTLRVQTAIQVLVGGEADCWDALAPLLEHEDFAVRTRLVTLLAAHLPKYRAGVLKVFDWQLTDRARRSALDVLARAPDLPDLDTILGTVVFLLDDNPGLRADAARVVRHWQSLAGVDADALAASIAQVDAMAQSDPVPYVRSAARAPRP